MPTLDELFFEALAARETRVSIDNEKVDDKAKPLKTRMITAAMNAGRINSSVEVLPVEDQNFTARSTVLNPFLTVVVLRKALVTDPKDVLLGSEGAEVPGPHLQLYKSTLQAMYTTRNDWVNQKIHTILEQVLELARRVRTLLHLDATMLFRTLRYALLALGVEVTALQADYLHKEVSKPVGQKFSAFKRMREEDFAWGDPCVKSLRTTRSEE